MIIHPFMFVFGLLSMFTTLEINKTKYSTPFIILGAILIYNSFN